MDIKNARSKMGSEPSRLFQMYSIAKMSIIFGLTK